MEKNQNAYQFNNGGDKYVLSIKPNPAVFADKWNPEAAKKDIKEKLKQTEGCNVEIIMKDISTVNHDPKRLWEWAKIAMECVC